MNKLDLIGEKLLNIRIKTVFPYISGRLLDIGCGTNKLARLYNDAIGVDVFQFGDCDLIVGDTSKLPFNDRSFDTITIIATLNHIPNREQVIKETNRLLKDGGSLIITMIPPGISKIWHIIRSPWDRDQKERGMKNGEVFGINNTDLIKMIEKNNFLLSNKSKFMFGVNNLFIFKKQ